jgi:hypothetical protein
MPDISAYADAFREWDKLIGALNANGSLVPGHEGLKGELLATLEQAKQLKIEQESLTGNRLAATDRFLNKVDEGRLKFSQLRSFVVSVLGPRSPLLSLFGVPAKPEKIVNPRLRKTRAKTPSQPTGTKPAPAGPPTGAPPAPEGQPTKAAEPDKVKE